jgi:hypothetical protein
VLLALGKRAAIVVALALVGHALVVAAARPVGALIVVGALFAEAACTHQAVGAVSVAAAFGALPIDALAAGGKAIRVLHTRVAVTVDAGSFEAVGVIAAHVAVDALFVLASAASVAAAVEVVEAVHLDTASVEHGDLQVGLVARAVHAQQGFLAVARSLTALAKAGQDLVLASAEQTQDQNNPYASSQKTSHASLCRMLEGGPQLRTMTKISALARRRVQRS